jgi:hypothetical protein
VKRLYIGRFASSFVAGRNGPVHGFLLDHPQMQGIIDVNSDGTRAKGRFRSMMSAGTHESIKETHPRGMVQWWEGGIYENGEYEIHLPLRHTLTFDLYRWQSTSNRTAFGNSGG